MDTETKPTVAQKVDDNVASITAEVSKLRSELAGVLESVGRAGRDKVHAVTHSDTVTKGVAAGEAAVDTVTKELRALEHDIAESTRAYPWRALGIAGCVGFLIGVLVRR
jgi:ElaB/YqjD/DUF883 family membrane-anchored ribosome-binding protein